MLKPSLIVLRQSPSWSSLISVDQLQPELFDKKVGLSPGTTRRTINLWNSTMPMSYFALRHKLKEVSLSNYRRAFLCDLDTSQHRTRLSRRRVLHFTDDDDFISPFWSLRVPFFPTNIPFCRWVSVRFDGHFQFRSNSSSYSYTNSYCIYPFSYNRYSFNEIYQHFHQSALYDRLPQDQQCFVDLPLSITHKHPASINTLRKSLESSDWNPDQIAVDINNYIVKSTKSDVPDSLCWFLPFKRRLIDIFASLLV